MLSLVVAGFNKSEVIHFEGVNTPLQYFLNQFCEKHNMSPKSYGLKYRSKKLDLSKPFRLSSVPKNATVEVYEKSALETQKYGNVLVGIQCADGTRYKIKAPLSFTLWDCLKQAEKVAAQQSGKVVNFTKQFKDNNSRYYLIPTLNYMNQLYATLEQLQSTTIYDLGLRNHENLLVRLHYQTADTTIDELLNQGLLEESSQTRHESRTEESSTYQEQHTTSKDPQSKIDEQSHNAENQIELSKSQVAARHTSNELPETTPSKNSQAEEEPNENVIQLSNNSTSLSSSGSTPQSSSSTQSIHIENTIATDIKIYRQDQQESTHDDLADIKDEDFELRKEEFEKIYHDLRKQQQGDFLKTRKIREQEAQQRERTYSETIIRIRFPDGLILQGKFHPDHKVGNVYKFVKQALQDPNFPFNLFITPPPTRLDQKSKKLKEAKLVPAAIINIGPDRQDPKIQAYQDQQPRLKDELISQVQILQTESIPKHESPQEQQQQQKPQQHLSHKYQKKQQQKREKSKSQDNTSKEEKEKKLKKFFQLK